jgi:hypothetical protein
MCWPKSALSPKITLDDATPAFFAISMKLALVSAPASTSHRYTFLRLRITLNHTSTLSYSSLYLPRSEGYNG